MKEKTAKDSIFSSFCSRYANYIKGKVNRFVRGGMLQEDAVQEIHLLIWESMNHPKFNMMDHYDAWIYRHVARRHHRILQTFWKRENISSSEEINHDITSDSGDIETGGLSGERHYSSSDQVDAKLWIEKALEASALLPEKQRKTVKAWLQPEELLQFSNGRAVHAIETYLEWEERKKLCEEIGEEPPERPSDAWDGRTHSGDYEVASTTDLRLFTGEPEAGKLLRKGMRFLMKKIGHPFEDHQPSIHKVHPGSLPDIPLSVPESATEETYTDSGQMSLFDEA